MSISRIQMNLMAACFAIAMVVLAPSTNAKDQYHLQFVPQEGQNLSWDRGVSSIDSIAAGSIVRVIDSRDKLPDDQTTFRVIVLNTAGESVNVDPSNIWIEDAEANQLAMLSRDELEARHRRDVKRRQALAALGGALSAGSANGHTTGSFNYSGSTSYGTSFSGFGTYSAYDPALAFHQRQAAAAQTQAAFNALQVRQLAGVEALNGMLRQTTLNPGEITSGIVAFDPPRTMRRKAGEERVTIVVRVGSSEHRIQVKLIELP